MAALLAATHVEKWMTRLSPAAATLAQLVRRSCVVQCMRSASHTGAISERAEAKNSSNIFNLD